MPTFWSMGRRWWKVLLDLLRGKTNSETWRGLVLSFHTHTQSPQCFSQQFHPFLHIPFVTSCPTTPAPSLSGLYGEKNPHKVTFQVLWSNRHSGPGVWGEELGYKAVSIFAKG